MRFQETLDSLPIVAVFITFAIIALLTYEVGFRAGRWWQERTPDEKEGPTGVLVGSLFALMAFLLAITMGMASDRFDTRRGLVLAEANSIGTTFLRAGYLPEPAASESQELLREYASLRTTTNDLAEVRARIARSVQIQDSGPRRRIWLALRLTRTSSQSTSSPSTRPSISTRPGSPPACTPGCPKRSCSSSSSDPHSRWACWATARA
jgi:hypothetical protein